jgi:hypothetical protein
MRKTKTVIIDTEGRDKGKHYLITEMSSGNAETWGLRALSAMARSGVEIPADIANAGLVGLKLLGLRAFLSMPFQDAVPLFAEMMTCVAFIPDPSRPMVFRSPPWDDDIEEVATRLLLRSEVIELHTGFSIAEGFLRSTTPEIPPDQAAPSS